MQLGMAVGVSAHKSLGCIDTCLQLQFISSSMMARCSNFTLFKHSPCHCNHPRAAAPHMGSAYPTIAADAAARFQVRRRLTCHPQFPTQMDQQQM